MAALLCTNGAAGSLPVPRRRTSTYDVALIAPVSARRRRLPSRVLRCTGTEVSAAEKADVLATVKEAEDVPLPPFEQSLMAVGSVADEAAVSKLGFKETFTFVMYCTGAFIAGWTSSAVLSAIESVPLFPRILEIVGLGYTIWFSTRYLVFKENRDELFAKGYDLKLRIVGPGDA